MEGIDMNAPMTYHGASLRFFEAGEHHVTRFCKVNVLLLVFGGVLRFTENGVPCEVAAGEYYIQKANTAQDGPCPSDTPRYFYLHFDASWVEEGVCLSRRGSFDIARWHPFFEGFHADAHACAPQALLLKRFYELMAGLYGNPQTDRMAEALDAYVRENCHTALTLSMLSEKFHFSKNYMIRLFKQHFHCTPVAYINEKRLQQAEERMEMTSEPIESIAVRCGFPSYSHFYRLFSRSRGTSPRCWREKKRLGR